VADFATKNKRSTAKPHRRRAEHEEDDDDENDDGGGRTNGIRAMTNGVGGGGSKAPRGDYER